MRVRPDREGYPRNRGSFLSATLSKPNMRQNSQNSSANACGTQNQPRKAHGSRSGANEDKMRIARRAKELNLDAIHDTVHEMAKDEARHGQGFQGLYKRFFQK